MSSLFGLGQDLDLSLFVTPVSPQALLEGRNNGFFKKKNLGKMFCISCFPLFSRTQFLAHTRKTLWPSDLPHPLFQLLLIFWRSDGHIVILSFHLLQNRHN